MSLNTNGRCEYCGGAVRNIPTKRHPIDRLTTIHDETCPGRLRRKTTP